MIPITTLIALEKPWLNAVFVFLFASYFPIILSRSGILNPGTANILNWVILCCVWLSCALYDV